MNAKANTSDRILFNPDLLDRAFAAHARASSEETYQQPSKYDSDVRAVDGKAYVMLRNINGILKVYRVHNNETIKGMKCWPTVLEQLLH